MMRDLKKIFIGALISAGTIGYVIGFLCGYFVEIIF